MKLGLLMKRKPGLPDINGALQIDGKELYVGDPDTGERLENQAGMLWGPGEILMEPTEEGLFTKEHFDPNKDYLVVVVECETAKVIA